MSEPMYRFTKRTFRERLFSLTPHVSHMKIRDYNAEQAREIIENETIRRERKEKLRREALGDQAPTRSQVAARFANPYAASQPSEKFLELMSRPISDVVAEAKQGAR